MINRRSFLQKSVVAGATLGIASCAPSALRLAEKQLNIQYSSRYLPKLRISLDRVVKETVGLRPYRTIGPRIEKETLGSKTLVHNYGHGGSGWSLSWGSAELATNLVDSSWASKISLVSSATDAMVLPPSSARKVAVIGCGVIGLTTARALQRRGYEVTIYTREMAPDITSSKATGTWSPAHRLIDSNKVNDNFFQQFKQMHQTSFLSFQNLLGLGNLVVWTDSYDVRQEAASPPHGDLPTNEKYSFMQVLPKPKRLADKEHPFRAPVVYRRTSMVFNIPSLLKLYTDDFLRFGGTVKVQEFKRLEDLDALPETCIVNCTGIGAKRLTDDPHLMPIAGQLAFVIPQQEVNYRIATRGAYTINRKDGIVVGGTHKMGSWETTPSREDTERMVLSIKEVADEMYT
ncbi:MAG: FAD-dependent oxidoreductase [Tunicatimonas sp.]|uniref:FAD-dependent oxidoreductase n=1 Tax=Tunicatimonas sp. TaxID=1940096 RepID=UPI003C7818A5